MSLGFLTESALMPSRSKKIEVDSSSLIALKAALYQGEQTVKSQTTKSLRHMRAKNPNPRSLRDPMHTSKKNKGIDHRNANDEEAAELNDKEKTYAAALRAKAEIYDKLARGEMNDADTFLVNFEQKKQDEPLTTVPTTRQETVSDDEMDDMVEVQDEFGRVRSLNKRSSEYKEYLQSGKRQKVENRPERFTDEEARGADQYAWGTGRDRDDAGEWVEDARKRGKDMEAHVQDAIHSEVVMSKEARVKSQWEKKLSADAKHYLSQIRKDTASSRTATPAVRDKDRRRELLRKKQQQHAQCALTQQPTQSQT